jgi:nitrite reductase/ring-hydroxylating ferredoxin subunit
MEHIMHAPTTDFIRVGTLEELKQKGCIVVRGAVHPIAVFYDKGTVHAVDNRCPHMGFPLSRGSVSDGILTCHWHHARFDLSSGCTFDLFADDVLTADVEIRDGVVFVSSTTNLAEPRAHWQKRLVEGMAQDIGLVIAKSIIALQRAGVDYREMLRDAAIFGVTHRDGWASGMTIMTAMANLVPALPQELQFFALYQGMTHVADDCAGQIPRRDRQALEGSDVSLDTLRQWLRKWTRVRHRDAAERTLLTAIQQCATPAQLAEMLLTAVTDRYYADGGHALDFINKSLELLDLIGWEHAEKIIPSVVRGLVGARGGEESSAWRHPIDLIALCESAFQQTPAWFEFARGKKWSGEEQLAADVSVDDPAKALAALEQAIRGGATPTQLSKSIAYAAAMRIARFGTSNEFGDWITALHTFTYCNALHQSMKRITAGSDAIPFEVLRGVFHGAMSIYLDRFLNVPAAALPGEREPLATSSATADELRDAYLKALDTQQSVNSAARVVAQYLAANHPIDKLIETLAEGVLREDAEFHTFQMLEAGVAQFREWGVTPAGRNILLAIARYSAAHSPTQRAQNQTAEIALKLDRGKSLHEEEA